MLQNVRRHYCALVALGTAVGHQEWGGVGWKTCRLRLSVRQHVWPVKKCESTPKRDVGVLGGAVVGWLMSLEAMYSRALTNFDALLAGWLFRVRDPCAMPWTLTHMEQQIPFVHVPPACVCSAATGGGEEGDSKCKTK